MLNIMKLKVKLKVWMLKNDKGEKYLPCKISDDYNYYIF